MTPVLLKRIRARPVGEAGFTLMEILVGVVLLALVSTGTASLISLANSNLSSSTSQNSSQAAIDSDISRARKLAEDYTCCPGSCTADPGTITTAKTAGRCAGNVNDSTYYFPQQSNDITAFTSACSTGTLTTNLITAIQSLGGLSGVTRTVTNDDSADLTAHRIRITYSGSGRSAGINRVVKIVPTVAGWCP